MFTVVQPTDTARPTGWIPPHKRGPNPIPTKQQYIPPHKRHAQVVAKAQQLTLVPYPESEASPQDTTFTTVATTNYHADTSGITTGSENSWTPTPANITSHYSAGAPIAVPGTRESRPKDKRPARAPNNRQPRDRQQSSKPHPSPWMRDRDPKQAQSTKPRSSPWVKDRDLKPDPKKWEEYERSDSGPHSAAADDGQGAKVHRRHADNSYDLKDWSGGWAPAPVDWDSRPAFRDNQSASHIEEWFDAVHTAHRSVSLVVDINPFIHDNQKACPFTSENTEIMAGDIVPRYWVPKTLENVAPLDYWQRYPMVQPDPLDEDDLKGVKPWWDQYPSQGNFHLQLVHPQIDGIDESQETVRERKARLNDKGVEEAIRRKYPPKKPKPQPKAEQVPHAAPIAPAPMLHSPAINLSIRRAMPADTRQINEIFNYYVLSSVRVPEMEPLLHDQMLQRIRDIKSAHLPFLVAIERNTNRTGKKSVTFQPQTLDHIVGIAYADDYNDMFGMYRFTIEMEIFVRPTHLRQGIAKCLMDAVLGQLDPDYMQKGGYHVVGDEDLGLGPQRMIKNIVINLPYAGQDAEEDNWMAGWLSTYNFKSAGDVKDVGVKLGKRHVSHRRCSD